MKRVSGRTLLVQVFYALTRYAWALGFEFRGHELTSQPVTAEVTASKRIEYRVPRNSSPGAKRSYAQGDIVTSVIRTERGKTVVVNYDMQLPRPYDNRWMLQGTGGVYSEQRNALYLIGKSPEYHQWERSPRTNSPSGSVRGCSSRPPYQEAAGQKVLLRR